MSLEPLSLDRLRNLGPRDPGPVSQLQWIKLADLVVDRAYQRDITSTSLRHIEKIAGAFEWSAFTPLIVSPIAGGKYALIDGQHRATAALLIGLETAPAQVVIADRARQAKAYAAINGAVTKMTARAIYRAAVAAGDPDALAVEAVAKSAGVRVLTYPVTTERMKSGDTGSAHSLLRALRRDGAETLKRALVAIMASKGDKRGLVNDNQIRALCILFRNKPWSLETIGRAFAHIDLRALEIEARREGFEGLYTDLSRLVGERLARLAARA